MGEFLMPSLGADMEHGIVLEWLVEPGDAVTKGDPIVVIDTDKSDIEAEVFESGTVTELLVEEGTDVPVGTPLATIAGSDERATDTIGTSPTVPAARVAQATPPAPASRASPPAQAPTSAHTAGVVLSPLVRRLADERHVDTASIVGSGPGGRVSRVDVETAAGRATAHTHPPSRGWTRSSPRARRLAREAGIDLPSIAGSGPGGAVVAADVPRAPRDRTARMRASIAEAMSRAKREIPHYYLQTTIDLGATMAWLERRNESMPVPGRLLPAALLLRATALAAADHPELNGWWTDRHEPADHVALGVAISLRGGGLVAPAIRDADQRTASELMGDLRELVARARAGRLRQSEYTGATITVTNLGDLGVDAVYGVINPPQLAMVGFGSVHDGPVVIDGDVVARPVVVATLAADHRASDGMTGARFLAELSAILRDPARLEPDDHDDTTGEETRP